EVVEGDVDAVVGDAVLGKVVGADAFAAIARAHHGLAGRAAAAFVLAQLLFVEPGAEHFQGLGLVLVLAALVLALHDKTGGYMGDANGGFGLVDMLAAGAAGAELVDAQVGVVDL